MKYIVCPKTVTGIRTSEPSSISGTVTFPSSGAPEAIEIKFNIENNPQRKAVFKRLILARLAELGKEIPFLGGRHPCPFPDSQ
jgi:hypothetical protein